MLLPIQTIFLPLLPLSVIDGWGMAQMGWKYLWWYFWYHSHCHVKVLCGGAHGANRGEVSQKWRSRYPRLPQTWTAFLQMKYWPEQTQTYLIFVIFGRPPQFLACKKPAIEYVISQKNCLTSKLRKFLLFLASQDALEVMRVTHLLTDWVDVSIDFTDVTLVSDDTYRRLYWCDPDDPDESYLVLKVI